MSSAAVGRHRHPRGGAHRARRSGAGPVARLGTAGLIAVVLGGIGTIAGTAGVDGSVRAERLGTEAGARIAGMLGVAAPESAGGVSAEALSQGRTAALGSVGQRSSARPAPPSLSQAPQVVTGRLLAAVEQTSQAVAQQQSLRAAVDTAAAGPDLAAEAAREPSFHAPVLEGRQTSGFGWRWGRMHNGNDYSAAHGSPLYAVTSATVTTTGWNDGLGYHVKITVDDGTVLVYGHLSRIRVEEGEPVQPGTVLGEVGSTGRSTGAHLHLEVRIDDEPVDPGPWLTERLGDWR